jgi:hypothetical protein
MLAETQHPIEVPPFTAHYNPESVTWHGSESDTQYRIWLDTVTRKVKDYWDCHLRRSRDLDTGPYVRRAAIRLLTAAQPTLHEVATHLGRYQTSLADTIARLEQDKSREARELLGDTKAESYRLSHIAKAWTLAATTLDILLLRQEDSRDSSLMAQKLANLSPSRSPQLREVDRYLPLWEVDLLPLHNRFALPRLRHVSETPYWARQPYHHPDSHRVFQTITHASRLLTLEQPLIQSLAATLTHITLANTLPDTPTLSIRLHALSLILNQ